MILIDEAADDCLVKSLEQLRLAPGDCRCVHFKFTGDSKPTLYLESAALHRAVVETIEAHLTIRDSKLYLCEDGDVFVIGEGITDKVARNLIVAVAQRLYVTADGLADYYHFDSQIDAVVRIVEEKQKRRMQAQAALRKQRAVLDAARKREHILNPLISPAQGKSISSRRRNRYAPELMMIEDDIFSVRLVEALLKDKFRLTTLTDPEFALVSYVERAPDILFLDIGLPNVTGHELLKALLKLDPDAFIIMLSGHADRDNVTKALEVGAKGFIAKPFTRDKIMQYIDRCPTLSVKGKI